MEVFFTKFLERYKGNNRPKVGSVIQASGITRVANEFIERSSDTREQREIIEATKGIDKSIKEAILKAMTKGDITDEV